MASIVERINQNTTSVMSGKDDIKNAILEKGGTVPENPVSGVPTFSNLVEGINSISGGGNTLIYPQSPQSSIVSYNFGSDGNLQLQIGKVTSQSYDRTYAVVRKPANTIEFPVSETELIDVGSNVDTFTVPNTSGEETFSVMLISKDKAGNYQTVKTINNVMEGVKGIGAKGMFIEAILPEELQQYSSFNAVLTSKGRLLVSSNTSSCKGLWSYIDGAFVKVFEGSYSWKNIAEEEGLTILASTVDGSNILKVLDDGTVKAVYTETDARSSPLNSIKTQSNEYYFTISPLFLKFNKETDMLESISTSVTDIEKIIELESGNLLLLSDYENAASKEFDVTTKEINTAFSSWEYRSHTYINNNLIIFCANDYTGYYSAINYKDKDNKKTFTGEYDEKIDFYVTRKGKVYVTGFKVRTINIDTMTIENDNFTNSTGVYDYMDDEDGNLFYFSDNRSTKKFYYVNEDTNTVELIDDTNLQTTSYPLFYVLSKNKLFIQLSNTKSVIFDTLNKTILQQANVGISYDDEFIKLSSNITLLTSRPNSSSDGVLIINNSENTITKISNVGQLYRDDTGDYLYASSSKNKADTALIQVLKINPTTGITEGINAYCHKYLGQGLGIDLTNKIIYKKDQKIGNFVGTYTGVPTTNNSVFYFLFDTSSEEKKVLFTY